MVGLALVNSTVVVGCLAGIALLAACASDPGANSDSTDAGISQDIPEFSGPWADEFAYAYKTAKSDFARTVLATGKIIESDLAEAQQADQECLEGLGFTEVVHFPGGGMSMVDPVGKSDAEASDLVGSCSDQSGLTQIESLYNGMKINSNNENMDELAVKCLIEEKIVEPSFTVADLQSWYDNEDPRLLSTGEAGNCTYDPLRLSGDW